MAAISLIPEIVGINRLRQKWSPAQEALKAADDYNAKLVGRSSRSLTEATATTVGDASATTKPSTVSLPTAAIRIDGNFDDWNSVPPVVIQDAPDKSSVSKVFLAMDKENFYVRLNIADTTQRSFQGHNFSELPGDSFYAIDIDNGDSQKNVILRIVHWDHPWGGGLGWYLELCHGVKGSFHHPYDYPKSLPSIGQYAMQGSSLEISVPLTKVRKALGDPGPTGKYRVFGWTGKGWDDISDSRQTDPGYFSF